MRLSVRRGGRDAAEVGCAGPPVRGRTERSFRRLGPAAAGSACADPGGDPECAAHEGLAGL